MKAFAICFIAATADITSLQWADGKLEADLDVLPNDAAGYTNRLLKLTSSADDDTLTVDACAFHPELGTSGQPIICQISAQNTVVVSVKSPIKNIQSKPFPGGQETKDDGLDTTWAFDGPMPPLTVTLDAPFNVLATSWLRNRDYNFALPFGSSVSIDRYYIADSSAIWLALIVAAVLLRGKYTAGPLLHGKRAPNRPLGASRPLLLIVLAGVLLGVQTKQLGYLGDQFADGVVVAVTWGVLLAAVAPKRMVPKIAALSVAAAAPMCLVVVAGKWMNLPEVILLQTLYGPLFAFLFMLTAWALWRRITTLFAVANLDDGTSKWHTANRRVIECLMVVAFMFAIGFPLGEPLNFVHQEHGQPTISYAILNLIFYTGVLFRVPLGWISLLLAISYLTTYLTNPAHGAIVALRPSPWHRTRWIRVGNRAVAALLALTLCLSAPWTSRFAVGVIPVWILQFGVLWLAFTLLSSRSGLRRLRRPPNARMADLLAAATGSPRKKPPPNDSDDDGGAGDAPQAAPQTPDPKAGTRLLILGPQPDRFPEESVASSQRRTWRITKAKDAAQIASIIAIIPVTYLIWTTLAQLGALSTTTRIFIVALLAMLEFARWVVSGLLFGYLYAKLPGPVGPVKALAFAAIWTLSCIGPLVIAQISGSKLAHETFYRSAQFALFAIVLAVLIDLKTATSAGGSWRDLPTVYNLKNAAELVGAVTPAALLVLALVQQIKTGSGTQVANTLLSGITNVLQGPLGR